MTWRLISNGVVEQMNIPKGIIPSGIIPEGILVMKAAVIRFAMMGATNVAAPILRGMALGTGVFGILDQEMSYRSLIPDGPKC
jgi:hypothetical protein